MEPKTKLQKRDHYCILVAAVRCAELIRAHLGPEPGPVELRLEDPDFPGWDDIVEVRRTPEGSTRHVWQVKRQRTDWREKPFGKLLRQLDAADVEQGHLALYSLTRVKPIGELSVLEALCQRVQQPGADLARCERKLTRAERQWCRFIQQALSKSDVRSTLQFLRKLDISECRSEANLKRAGEAALWAWYRDRSPLVLAALVAFLHEHSDSIVTVDYPLLEKEALRPFARREALPGGKTPARVREQYLSAVLQISERPALLRIATHEERQATVRIEDVLVLPDITEAYDGDDASRREREPELEQSQGREPGSPGTPHSTLQPKDRQSLKPRRRPVLDLLEALRQHGSSGGRALFLVEGPVGSGKSVFLEHLCLEVARAAQASAEAPLPILLDALDLVDGNLERAVQRRMPGLAEEGVLDVEDARYVFLVDGLDEVERRSEVKISGCLKDLAQRRSTAALVIASRPDAPLFLTPEPQRLRINPWRAEQVERFLARWEARAPDQVAQVRGLRDSAAVMPLLRNPLTATFCLLLAQEDPGALRSRAALFRGITAKLFQDWATYRPTHGHAPSWGDVAPSFQDLALKMLQDGEDAVERPELLRRLSSLARDRDLEYLEVSQRRFGLLVHQPDGRFRFLVKGIAEHLAGGALLRRGEKEILASAEQRWAEEPVRHAVGLAAELERPERALKMVGELLPASRKAIGTLTVRRTIVALRVTLDLGHASAPVAEPVAEALATVVENESSRWAWQRASEEIRELERAGGPCWDALRKRLEHPLAVREHPARWFAGIQDRPWQWWATVFFHQDPTVRLVAIDRLSEHADEPEVQELLFLQLFDTSSFSPMSDGLLPTRAALALRKARRPLANQVVLSNLRAEIHRTSLISGGAAAAALLPIEAPPRELVMALQELYRFRRRPPGVVEAIAGLEEGRAVLAELWPGWEKCECEAIEPIPRLEGPNLPIPPLSPAARRQVILALGGAVASLTPQDRERLGLDPATDPAVAYALCEGAREHPEPALALLESNHSFFLTASAGRAIGRGALIHSRLRNAVLEYAERMEPRFHRVLVGPMLESLVVAGDEDAARRYGQWLLRFGSEVVPLDLPETPVRVLLHPLVRESAVAVALGAWKKHFEGFLDEKGEPTRIAAGSMAVTLSTLRPVWEDVEPIRKGLLDLAQRDDLDSLGLLMSVYPEPPYPESVAASAIKYFAGLKEPDKRAAFFQLPACIEWASRAGIGSAIETTLRNLSDHPSSLRYAATAALVTSLGPERAEAFSARLAPEWPLWWLDAEEGERELALLASAAPLAWRDRLMQMAEESAFGLALQGGLGFMVARLVMPHLRSREERRQLFLKLERTVGGLNHLWVGAGPVSHPTRPHDRLQELHFDSA